MEKRRKFLKKALLTGAAISIPSIFASCKAKETGSSTNTSSQKFNWKMVTAWPPNFPIYGEQLLRFSENIEKASNGRLKIQVYGGGELVPALESFDAVRTGTAQIGHAASYYWAGKSPAAQIFTTIPFGMDANQTYSWLAYGGGMKLWEDLYSKFNLIPFSCGNTYGQMGGWFKKEINSVEDFKGLKMRIPGLGGRVITKLGGSAVLSPGSELYTNLERGVIDALEWVGPYHDYVMGFHKVAKYYYSPGWQEPSGMTEIFINKKAFDELPEDLKEILKLSIRKTDFEISIEMYAKNFEYYLKLRKEGNVIFKEFPKPVIDTLKKVSAEVVKELSSSNPEAKKILDSYLDYNKYISEWTDKIEKNWEFEV